MDFSGIPYSLATRLAENTDGPGIALERPKRAATDPDPTQSD
jgi:hypothetical protein